MRDRLCPLATVVGLAERASDLMRCQTADVNWGGDNCGPEHSIRMDGASLPTTSLGLSSEEVPGKTRDLLHIRGGD